jgi:hypothetical protein
LGLGVLGPGAVSSVDELVLLSVRGWSLTIPLLEDLLDPKQAHKGIVVAVLRNLPTSPDLPSCHSIVPELAQQCGHHCCAHGSGAHELELETQHQ